MRYALTAVAAFLVGVFVAATSAQLRAQLEAAAAAPDPERPRSPLEVIDAEAEEAAAYLRAMGVNVGG
jgi:hypothetical protein